ncbi:MAG: KH domain-containing protein [Candidatus Asgardarchaeia archaeon]
MNIPIYVKIPKQRIGVLIGKRGKTKREIERLTQTKIDVSSSDGQVKIVLNNNALDPLGHLKAKAIIQAIGRGFSPEKAMRLIEDNTTMEIIDITEFASTKNSLIRLKGRLIGENGRARRIIEETTGADISIYGHTVAIIGHVDEVYAAKQAIIMLLQGAQHGTVYKFLRRYKYNLKKKELERLGRRVE